jgi:hypothetical protein
MPKKKTTPDPMMKHYPWYLPPSPVLEDTLELRRILAALPNTRPQLVLKKSA